MTTIPTHPMELKRGDILAIHPLTGKRGTWTVTDPPVQYGDCAQFEVNDDAGVHSCIPVSVHTTLTVQPSERQELISGLRALAQFLEDNPDVPVGRVAYVTYYPENHGLADPIAEVDRIAGLLGVEPTAGVHYEARRMFGGVEYMAVMCNHEAVTVTAPATDAAVSA